MAILSLSAVLHCVIINIVISTHCLKFHVLCTELHDLNHPGCSQKSDNLSWQLTYSHQNPSKVTNADLLLKVEHEKQLENWILNRILSATTNGILMKKSNKNFNPPFVVVSFGEFSSNFGTGILSAHPVAVTSSKNLCKCRRQLPQQWVVAFVEI